MKTSNLKSFFILLAAMFASYANAAPALVFEESFDSPAALGNFDIFQTGRKSMSYQVANGRIEASSSVEYESEQAYDENGEPVKDKNGNDSFTNKQVLVFSRPLDTSGTGGVLLDLTYKCDAAAVHEGPDFIKILGYDGDPMDSSHPTPGESYWIRKNPVVEYVRRRKQPGGLETVSVLFNDSYAADNPDFHYGIAVSSNSPDEVFKIDHLAVYTNARSELALIDFEEGDETKALDQVGDHDCLIENGGLGEGLDGGRALEFNEAKKSSDIVTKATIDDFDYGENFSVTLWFKADKWLSKRNYAVLYNHGGDPDESAHCVNIYACNFSSKDKRVIFDAADGKNADGSSSTRRFQLYNTDAFDGEWHMIAMTFEYGGTVKAYYDGVEVPQTSGSTANWRVSDPEGPITLGAVPVELPKQGYEAWDYRLSFFGLIDEPAIHGQCLEADEVAGIYSDAAPMMVDKFKFSAKRDGAEAIGNQGAPFGSFAVNKVAIGTNRRGQLKIKAKGVFDTDEMPLADPESELVVYFDDLAVPVNASRLDGRKSVYSLKDDNIKVKLNFKKGVWSLVVKDASGLGDIDVSDGVDVHMTLGETGGAVRLLDVK